MATNASIPVDVAAVAIANIADAQIAAAAKTSVISPLGDSDLNSPTPGMTVGGVAPPYFAAGNGKSTAGAAAFTNIPDVFNPSSLEISSIPADESGTPEPPRYGSATQTFLSDVVGSTETVSIQWTPPLVDTNGRWLVMSNTNPSTGVVTVSDLLDTYLVIRTNPATGEVHTLGAIDHNEQAVSAIKAWCEANGKCTTDPLTLVVSFDPSIVVNGVVTIPEAEEQWFFFTDQTAIYGETYTYDIHAITVAEITSEPLTIEPEAPTAAGTLGVQVPNAWVTTYPDLTDPTGNTSYADIEFVVTGITTAVAIGLVAFQANALAIAKNTASATAPYIEYTTPNEVIIEPPTTGTHAYLFAFRGSYIEENGGLTSVTCNSAITVAGAVASNLTKAPVVGSAANEYDYVLTLTVSSAAVAGPVTLTFTCANGSTFQCSALTIGDEPIVYATPPAFSTSTFSGSSLTADVLIAGVGLNNILSLQMYSATGTLLGTATITNQAANLLEFTYTFPSYSTYRIVSVIAEGITSSGKDTAAITLTAAPATNPNQGTITDPPEHNTGNGGDRGSDGGNGGGSDGGGGE